MRIPGEPQPQPQPGLPLGAGLDHVAFTYGSLADLATAYRQRRARGLVPYWSVNHGITASLYYVDPDGNKVEFQVDAFASPEEQTAFMLSPQFAENPIGVDFEPEALFAEVDAGVPESVLLVQKGIGPRDADTVPRCPKPLVKTSYDVIEA